MPKRSFQCFLAALALAAGGCDDPSKEEAAREAAQATNPGQQGALQSDAGAGGDWLTAGGDYRQTRFSSLNEITAANVGDLKVAWTFATGLVRGHEAAPLVVNNTMYIVTPFPNNV